MCVVPDALPQDDISETIISDMQCNHMRHVASVANQTGLDSTIISICVFYRLFWYAYLFLL